MTTAACTGFAVETDAVPLELWFSMAAALAEGCVQANLRWLLHHRVSAMPLVRLGVVFEARCAALARGGQLVWPVRLAPVLIRDRRGNCLDVSCYHAAWLRLLGDARACVRILVPDGALEGHAVVAHAGTTFDPRELCR